MKIDINELWSCGKNDYMALYYKKNKWRIYEGSSYRLRSDKSKHELISEVASEKRVGVNAIRLVKPKYVVVD